MDDKTIGRDYDLKSLFIFSLGPVFTQFLLTILQTIDDGLFLSRYIGENALAAFSICMPVIMLIDALAALFAGSSVYCSRLMGDGKGEKARGVFTQTVLYVTIFGVIFSVVVFVFKKQILKFVGCTDLLFDYANDYLSTMLLGVSLTLVNFIYSRFYVVSGKPQNALVTTIINSVCNLFFDYLFIVRMNVGIKGSAYANIIGVICCLVYGTIFYHSDKCEIGYGKMETDIGNLKEVFSYGMSEAVNSVSLSINSYIANRAVLKIAGELCLSAYTIVNNIQFAFMSVFFSLCNACSPLVSYAYGEDNKEKLNKLIKTVATLIGLYVVAVVLIYILGKNGIINIYLKEDASLELRRMSEYGLRVAPLAFIFFGYVTIIKELLVATNRNKEATFITTMDNLIFSNMSIMFIPVLFKRNGIWYCFIVQEVLALTLCAIVLLKKNKGYKYNLRNN